MLASDIGFNPSKENTAVLTVLVVAACGPAGGFQPLKGKHGRSDLESNVESRWYYSFNPSKENTAVLTISCYT